MSAQQRRRIARALALVTAGFALLLAAAGVERAVLDADGGPAAADAPLQATVMAQAALDAAVGEALSPFAVSPGDDAAMPDWLEELLFVMGPAEEVLVDGSGSIASFTRAECTTDDGCLEQALAACGWRGLSAGIEGCASYVREEGEGQWLAVSQWQMGQDVVVLAQCA